MDPTFFMSKKVANQWELSKKVASNEKILKWKTGLISQANGSKVVYLLADPNVGPFPLGWFPLVCWILHNVTVNQTIWLVNMLIILFLMFWYDMINTEKANWGEFSLCVCSLKPIIFEYCYNMLCCIG